MAVALVRMRLPAAVAAGEVRPGLAAIRAICASSPSSSTAATSDVLSGKSSQNAGNNPLSGPAAASSTAAKDADTGGRLPTNVSSSSADGPKNAMKQSLSAKASKWVWRGIFTAAGAAAAGGAAVYITDPESTKEMASSFRNELDQKVRFFTEPSRDKLLPDAVAPFPGAKPLRTLVINLDETLVHSSYSRKFGWRVAKRPGAEAFLAYMSSFYEIVVFTSGLNTYADPILNKLDPNKYYISYRLYRAETKYEKGVHVKDLSHLNRDLSRVILIENNPLHFKYQPENAILVPSWSDDANDTALLDLIPFLEDMVHEDVSDVRTQVATLQGKPLQTALAEYRALASTRSDRMPASRGSLFGLNSSSDSRRSPEVSALSESPLDGSRDDKDVSKSENSKKSLWGQVSRSGSLFRPASQQPINVSGDAGSSE